MCHENRIMPFRLPQNNHATCDYIIGKNSCSRDMTNAGMFLMDSSSPCLFSLASASIMSIELFVSWLLLMLRLLLYISVGVLLQDTAVSNCWTLGFMDMSPFSDFSAGKFNL